MDKINRIKRLVESSLGTSFGDEFSINEMLILPTQKFNETTKEWVPDSHTIFLSLKKKNPPPKKEYFHFESDGNSRDIRGVTNLVESLLGFECCVDFV